MSRHQRVLLHTANQHTCTVHLRPPFPSAQLTNKGNNQMPLHPVQAVASLSHHRILHTHKQQHGHVCTTHRACERASSGSRIMRSAFSPMMSGLNDRLWGLSGVTRVQGTLGATMEPPADME